MHGSMSLIFVGFYLWPWSNNFLALIKVAAALLGHPKTSSQTMIQKPFLNSSGWTSLTFRWSPEPTSAFDSRPFPAFDSRPFPARKESTDTNERFAERNDWFTDIYKTSPKRVDSSDDEAHRLKLVRATAKMRFMSIGNLNSPLKETRVVVSNLAPSVNWEDIVEMFGDIGNLKQAKMTEPGRAEVIFHKREDALKSVQVYHRREFDGQYMQVSIREQSTDNPSAACGNSNDFGTSNVFETNRLFDSSNTHFHTNKT